MSERNGDRARFQKIRKRKLAQRQRIRALLSGLMTRTAGARPRRPGVAATPTGAPSAEPSLARRDGGAMRAGE